MKVALRPLGLILAVALALAAATSPGAEASPTDPAGKRILRFSSHIVVYPDSSMTVTEEITIRQTEARHGLVRDFPTTYRDRFGKTVKVGLAVEEVRRDGGREPYHIKYEANGARIFLGEKNVILPPGTYTYTISYRTSHQLGYFQDFDELYWNVTGNGWPFPIDRAEAVIELPPGAKVLEYDAYTGPQGARGKDFAVRPGDREIFFQTTRGLGPYQGLTVAVSWPKGLVRRPSVLSRDPGAFLALAGLLFLFWFYLAAWVKVGRDPAGGTIIPLFTPPHGFSPAAVRFLTHMGFDHKTFAAAVVDMAVKGHLLIQENEGVFTLVQKTDSPAGLSKGEGKVARELFADGKEVELKNDNRTLIKDAIDALKSHLKLKLEKVYFVTNSVYLVPGLVISLLAFGAVVAATPDRVTAAFSSLWLCIWTVGCYFLAVVAYRKWQAVRTGGLWGFLGAILVTLIALPFFAGELMGLGFFATTTSPIAALVLAAVVLLNALFYHLLKAPTLRGRKIMDLVEGFKLYLSVAEKERLEVLTPPEKTPELFEKYLPYAMALDVENEWNEQFAEVLARAGEDGQPYSPRWYSGSSWDGFDSSGFASSLGSSLSGAISSSSSAPGSDSGSGGGGVSGGGGGGGGGGDW